MRRLVEQSVLLSTILCLLWIHPSAAAEKVRVLVLPFEIHAREALEYLSDDIPAAIRRQLQQEGAVIVMPDAATVAAYKDTPFAIPDIRMAGVRAEADQIIWGSLTWIGENYSLDARMVEPYGNKPTQRVFLEGRGVETLFGTVQALTTELGLSLFKWERIVSLRVEGNERIESDAILRVVKTAPGDVMQVRKLSDDLRAIYQMGYFDDVRIESEDDPNGKDIIFRVTEKPTIRRIRVLGNHLYEDDEIRASLTQSVGTILNQVQVRNDVERIKDLYKEKNYHNADVTYKLIDLEKGQVAIEYAIEEGRKVRIQKIIFIGNSVYTDKKLKKLMKTSEASLLSWLTTAGELNRDDLDQDAERLAAYYHNDGYIQAKVGTPEVLFGEEGIEITIKIEEGPRFKVGQVQVIGDLVLPEIELLEKLKITKEVYFSREILRMDLLAMTDLYSDEGYAYADVIPRVDKNFEDLIVDITLDVTKGKQVYFEKIIISGNSKTRDKVIRRQLQIYEQELYSGVRLKKSVRHLHRLDYFQDIKVNTSKGSAEDKMILNLEVEEKSTGLFSFGGGYSSVEDAFGVISVAQRNLFGRGQVLNLKAFLGGRTTRYNLSFTEPWLFDIPLSAGVDLYDWEYDYDSYDKDSNGAGVRFGYPIHEYTRVYLSYNIDLSDIEDVESDAPVSIKELEGSNLTSSVATSINYDSRDRLFNPTEGSEHSLTLTYAGLGGDIGFTKVVAETGWYIPLFWETVGFIHAKGGYVDETAGKKLPDWERFYLGGINSLRGFDWDDLSLKDSEGNDRGGDHFVQFNLEFIFPLIKETGIMGVLFFDTGQIYDQSDTVDFGDLRESVGGGIRWYSPMGPIRIEYGYILDPIKGAGEGGKWEFSMGSAF